MFKARFIAYCLLCLLVSPSSLAVADPPMLGVVVPNVPAPYNAIFDSVLSGISAESSIPVRTYAVDKESGADLAAQLQKDRVSAVIALGRVGLDSVQASLGNLPIIVGNVMLPLGNDAKPGGISLLPDPELVVRQLGQFAPDVKRIAVVYNPQNYEATIQAITSAAARRHISVLKMPATDLRSGAKAYRELWDTIDATDALWIISDTTIIDDDVMLPAILERAWERRFVVFSNNVTHVKRGALFALYPDNAKLGRSLARRVLAEWNAARVVSTGAIEPLRDLKVAFNRRTADHLGIGASAENRAFDLVFPQ